MVVHLSGTRRVGAITARIGSAGSNIALLRSMYRTGRGVPKTAKSGVRGPIVRMGRDRAVGVAHSPQTHPEAPRLLLSLEYLSPVFLAPVLSLWASSHPERSARLWLVILPHSGRGWRPDPGQRSL